MTFFIKSHQRFGASIVPATQNMQALMVCLFSVILLTGCAPGNAEIARNVQSDLSILDDSIKVSVQNGVVTLRGQVTDESTKNAAESVVWGEKGVKSIVNYLTVKKDSLNHY